MNVRSNSFEINCEGNQAYDVVSSLLHTVLLHRTTGKFRYTKESSYVIGTLGFDEIDCDFVDFTYVRCSSPSFMRCIERQIKEFVDRLRTCSSQIGSISLEFYSKKRGRWSFSDDNLIWEIWTITLDCMHPTQSRLEEVLLDKVLSVVQVINSNKCFLPMIPSEQFLNTVFDTSFPDVQPYLHRIEYKVQNPGDVRSAITSPKAPVTALRDMVVDTLFKF